MNFRKNPRSLYRYIKVRKINRLLVVDLALFLAFGTEKGGKFSANFEFTNKKYKNGGTREFT